MSSRADAIRQAIDDTNESKLAVETNAKTWSMSHDAYNDMVSSSPKMGRYSGTALEDLRLYATSTYEQLLDAMSARKEICVLRRRLKLLISQV